VRLEDPLLHGRGRGSRLRRHQLLVGQRQGPPRVGRQHRRRAENKQGAVGSNPDNFLLLCTMENVLLSATYLHIYLCTYVVLGQGHTTILFSFLL
jgi:hypothetical protein